ncbi:VOC family protein, partial [Candidatus Bathyarchaeota archaeon]|nr:VOC family protein [Candidatus Bathyarchaeota archaeon]
LSKLIVLILYDCISHLKCMNALLKIDSIMFSVSNLEKATKFYEDVLGLKRIWTDTQSRGWLGSFFQKAILK